MATNIFPEFENSSTVCIFCGLLTGVLLAGNGPPPFDTWLLVFYLLVFSISFVMTNFVMKASNLMVSRLKHTTSISTNPEPACPKPTNPKSATPACTASHHFNYHDFTIINGGITPKGTRFWTRRYHQPGSNSTSDIGVHYSYLDGSYEYVNPDGTKFWSDRKGLSRRTRADGSGWTKQQFTAPNDTNANVSVTRSAGSTPTILTPPSSPSDTSYKDTDVAFDDEGFELLGSPEPAVLVVVIEEGY